MGKFERAVAVILEREGPYANDKWDNGGETKFGIARAAHPEISDDAWKNFSKSDALAVYRRQYWDRNRLDEFSFPVAVVMFDTGVQHGEGTAAFFLQRIVKTKVDGWIGPKSIQAAQRFSDDELVAWLMALRVKDIYHDHEDWEVAGRGWIRRITLVTIAAFAPEGGA